MIISRNKQLDTMSRNKYQRRRGLRPSTTAASAVQTELIQGPVTHSQSSTDVGREAARQIKEQNNPNTRYIDKPDATTNKNQLRAAQARQQAAMGAVQRQALGEGVGASLKPSGTFSAPSVPQPQPMKMQLVTKGGAVRLAPVPAIGANIAAAGAAMAIEQAAQPAIGWLAEKLARGLYAGSEAIFGDRDGVTFDEWQQIFAQAKQDVEQQRQQGLQPSAEEIQRQIEEMRKRIADMKKPTPRFGSPNESLLSQFNQAQMRKLRSAKNLEEQEKLVRQFKEQNSALQETKQESLVVQPQEATKAAQDDLREPQTDPRNREYHLRRAALGANPTKEDMAAVLAYGMEQHRLNFPELYRDKTPNPLMQDF